MDLRDKLKFWIMLSNYVDMIVRGTSPLSLPDAIANSLSYVKAFGGTEQRNLPDNYIERQFIYMMDGSYLAVTNQSITSDYKIEFDFATTNLSSSLGNYFGARASGVAAGGGFRVTKLSSQGVAMYGFDTTDAYESGANIMAANTRYKYVYENGTCKLSSGGTDVLTHTYTVNDTSTITAFGVNAYTSNGTTYSASGLGIYCYGLKMWNGQGELVMNLVPAVQKGTVPVVGFYDTVSGTFKTATAGTFAAGGEAVPTPDKPMDIVSNNGVLKARHQSGLPLGYTLLEYIESSGTQYIDTSVYISTGYKVRVKAYATSVPTTIAFFGCTSTASSSDANKGIYRIFGSSINRCAWGNGGGSVVGNLRGNDSINTWYDMVCDNGVWTINDTLFATVPASSFTAEYSMWLFARNTGGTVGLPASCRISVCQIWDNNGQMIRNFVPAKNSSNVVGMYDLVNGVFYQNAGTGTFTAGNPVNDIEIYTDGTVETINMHSKNLFDEQWTRNTGVSTQTATWGQVVTASGWSTSALIPVKVGQQYTVSYNTTTQIYVFYYESDGTMQQSYDTALGTKKTFTVPSGATHIRLQVNKSTEAQISELKSQLETGATATDYEPYFNGGTATAEMLLKVGDYQDVQSILDGVVTRNVGVKVLDGTEDWFVVTGYSNLYGLAVADGVFESNKLPMSTHYQGTTANNASMSNNTVKATTATVLAPNKVSIYVKDGANSTLENFKQYLADQYAAGTPVTVIYPLAQAGTEQVAPQVLNVQTGDNILEITQASLSNLELEAKYQKSA